MHCDNKVAESKCRVLLIVCFTVFVFLAGCAHPITINPNTTPKRAEDKIYSTQKVGYVITNADRAKQVTTVGGGGDTVSYFPYRDLEKGFRDALRSLYTDVVSIRSPHDSEAIKASGVSLLFVPEIYTSSGSNAFITWQPTQFTIDLTCSVLDSSGNIISRVRSTGYGTASYDDSDGDFGMAGKRAAQNALEVFTEEVRSNSRLK